MALVDESGGIRSNGVFASSNGISFSVQLKDQFSCDNDYAPKMRKPYTISKQRERWTEEEHTKFLEALKLYGRAWRKIEEHVGSKTAVQIRSHAQKFFYKVARDPSGGGGNANREDSIEIPPPRPKRKPMHPYPRKIIVQSPIKENSTTRSLSPDLSLSDEENCSPDSAMCLNPMDETAGSPKSVLSLMGSETGGSTGSSPVSSGSRSRNEILLERSESNTDSETASVSILISESPVKLELFSHDNEFAKESSTEEVPSRFLKLFGRSYLISDPKNSTDKREEKVESEVPQWPFYGGLLFPNHGKHQSRNLYEDHGSANNTRNRGDGKSYLEREETSPEPHVFKWKPSSRSAFSQLRIRTDKSRRGFVPYKRIIVAEEENQSEEKRTHLCL